MRLKITTPGREFEQTVGDGKQSVIIGNRALDDITIDDDPEVSGPHVRIEKFAGTWSFTDQFSNTGTFHNGEKTYNGDLKVGDVLKVGATEVQVLSLDGVSQAPSYQPERVVEAPEAEPVVETPEPVEPEPILKPAAPPQHNPKANEAAQPGSETREPPSVFVERIGEKLIREFEREHGFDPCKDQMAKARIIEAARKAVIELESVKQTEVNLPFLTADSAGPKHLTLTVHRKHLHEDSEHHQTPPRPQNRAGNAGQKKRPTPQSARRRAAAGVGVGIGFFIVITVITSVDWFATPSDEEPVSVAEAEALPIDDRASELELQKKVQALMQSEDATPQELIDQLDEYESQARAAGYRIGWDYERCRTHLASRVHRDVSLRYNEAARTLHDLRDADNYRQAEANVDDLRLYLNSSPHNERSINILDLDKTVQRWSEGHHADSEEFVAEQMLIMQEAVSRNDFEPAAIAISKVADGALLDDAVIEGCRKLHETLRSQEGEPVEPFHYRDRPPKSPENALLPKGDSGGYTHMRAYEGKVVKALRAGNVREFEVWGMRAVAEGEQRTSLLTLTYTLNLEDGVALEGTHRSMLSNLPDAVRLALLMQDDDLTSDELTGLLVFAFDNGLFEEAGGVAYQIRQAAPELKAELDEILSVKWNTPVPEGGFPERDGRVVRE